MNNHPASALLRTGLAIAAFLAATAGVVAQVPRATSDQQLTGKVAFSGDITPAQITANQNDYSPTGLAAAAILRLSTDASRNLTGLALGADGRILELDNVGSFPLVLKDDDGATSTAANRFSLDADYTLAAGTSVALRYDSTASRWRIVGLTAAALSGAYQPLAANLTSWAAVTRAAGFDTFTAAPSGANLASLLTTALPESKGGTGLTALGTGVATALGVNVGTAGAFIVNGGDAGTPSALVGTNITGTAAGLTVGNASVAPAGALTGTTLAANVVTSSITTVGALNSGSITPGFGSINVGTNPITGGAISGTTGTFSGAITRNNTNTDSLAFSSESSSAGANYYRLINTGGTYQFGVENSAATFVGVTAYDAFASVPNGKGYSFQMAGVGMLGRFTSTGLAVTGTLSATDDADFGGTGPGRVYAEGSSAAGNFVSNQTTADAIKYHMVFRESGTERGTITSNGSATAYNTSSGAEEKVLQAPATAVRLAQAAAAIDAIPLQDYTWKEDGSPGFGPTAQQLQAAVSSVAPAAVSPGEVYNWQVVHDRNLRRNGRAARNEAKLAGHRAALSTHIEQLKSAETVAATAEQARRALLGSEKLALLEQYKEQQRLLAEVPVGARTVDVVAADANFAALAAEVEKIPVSDRIPVIAVLPPEPIAPVLEQDPEDDIPDPKKWGVDYSKLVPALIAHAQVQKQRIDSLEARVAALEAAKTVAPGVNLLGGLGLIALLAGFRRFLS